MIFDVKIKKRENFDAMSERETISTQNIDFFDVAIEIAIDVTNNVSVNENFETIFDEITNNVNIDVDSFRDEIVAKMIKIAISLNVNFANFIFDVKKSVDIAIIDFDVIFENSFDVIIANSFDVNLRSRLQTFRFFSDDNSEYVDEISCCSKISQNNVCMQKLSNEFLFVFS